MLGKMVTIKVDFYWHVLHTYFDFIRGLRYKAFQTSKTCVQVSVVPTIAACVSKNLPESYPIQSPL